MLVNPGQIVNPETNERTQRYRLRNLQADSTYECLVQTKNKHGDGDISDLFHWYTAPKGRIIVQSDCQSPKSQFIVMFFSLVTVALINVT